jgi:large subunit ribosomal protein L25
LTGTRTEMDATLQAVKRGDKGKNEARRHRAAGRLPAVVYGAGGSTPVTVEPKALSRILHSESGANTLITLAVEGEADARVLVKEYQLDPVTRQMLHADFYRVAMDKPITVMVSVVLEGEPKGVKQQGGILDFVQREVEIECLPGDIPEHIVVDVSELMLNEGVRLRDVVKDVKWTPVSDLDTLLVHVITLRVAEEPVVAADAAATATTPAEPEVAKKGKTDKDEDKA